MKNDKIILQFRKEYREAYKGILPESILKQGNKWFETKLKEDRLQTLDKLYLDIYKMKGKTIDKQSGFIHKHIILDLIKAKLSTLQKGKV